MDSLTHIPNPRLDLTFERLVDLSPSQIWTAWTSEHHLKQWFTPSPWRTVDCEIDLRPGGIFRTVMLSPDGQEFPNLGCYLEIVPNEKLVWTNALGPGYRPIFQQSSNPADSFFFTAVVSIEPHEIGAKYSALVIHGDEDGCRRHKNMGFEAGWGLALDQLIAYMKAF